MVVLGEESAEDGKNDYGEDGDDDTVRELVLGLTAHDSNPRRKAKVICAKCARSWVELTMSMH